MEITGDVHEVNAFENVDGDVLSQPRNQTSSCESRPCGGGGNASFLSDLPAAMAALRSISP